MPAEQILALSGLCESVSRILQQGHHKPEPLLALALLGQDQGLVHQLGQQLEDIVLLYTTAGTNRLRRLQSPAAQKDRQPAEQELFHVSKQVVTPVDCRQQSLMARQCRSAASGQEIHPIVQPHIDLLHRQNLDARRCQLDRQRYAVEARAHSCQRRSILNVYCEVWFHRARAINKQLHAFMPAESPAVQLFLGVGRTEWRHAENKFARDPQRLPAGGQDPKVCRTAQQCVRDLSA